MILVSSQQTGHKEQLQQNLDIRVQLYKNQAEAEAEAESVDGVAELAAPAFVKRIGFTYSGTTTDIVVEYSHNGELYQRWEVVRATGAGAQVVDFRTPVWCSYVRVQTLAVDGSTDDFTPTVSVYAEASLDVTEYVRGDIIVEKAKDRELGFYRMTHCSVPFDNSSRAFVRRNTSSPLWDSVHQKSFVRAYAKILIEVMYRGEDMKRPETEAGDPEWIPLATFHVSEWHKTGSGKTVTASGDAGRVLLTTKTTQPVLEVVTPVDLLRERLVRDDDTQELLMAVRPDIRQKTETVWHEYVGKGETCSGMWKFVGELADARLVNVDHPWYVDLFETEAFDGKYLQVTQSAGERVRFGLTSDGSHFYSLLYIREDGWFVERISFQGAVTGALRLSDDDIHFLPDLTVVDDFLYVTANMGVHAKILKVHKSLTIPPTVLLDLEVTGPPYTGYRFYGITFSAGLGGLIVHAIYLNGSSGSPSPPDTLTFFVNPSTGSYTTAGFVEDGPLADYLDIVEDETLVWHKSGDDHISACDVGVIEEDETYPLGLDDNGGPICVAGKQLYLIRHALGVGVIARWGFWLENGNVQYDGATGFNEPLAFRQPIIRVDGQVKDATGTVSAAILTTDDYRINLYTGQLNFRYLLRNGARVTASYDYKYSLQYVRIERRNRMEVLNDLSISNNFVVYANGTNEMQFRERRWEEVFVAWTVADGVETNLRLGDTYESGGLPYIIHPSNTNYEWNTLRVYSADLVTQLTEGVDFSISYSGGRHFISFINTALVRRLEVVRVRYRVQQDVPELRDAWHMLDDQERWGDGKIINDVAVTGQKMLPGDNPISVQQIFALSPNATKQASRFANVQQADPTGLFDWNPAEKVVDDDSKPDALKKYFIEFDSPFVLGTTGYEVVYADARNGSGEYGVLMQGDQTHNQSTTSARFYKVTLPVTARDTEYFVMVDNNKEWRLATGDDYDDMIDNTTGGEPSDPGDVKTSAHFYLKQMNGNYGKRNVHFIAYYSVRVRYYVDRFGRVHEDSTFSPDDPTKNPLVTVTPEKRAALTLTPEDERQNPLFPYHNTSGQPGYYGQYTPPGGMNLFAGVIPAFSVLLSKVWADMLGVNFDYESWSGVTNFVRVETTGYPLTTIEKFEGRAPAEPQEIAVYGVREKALANEFIQNIQSARNLAWGVKRQQSGEPQEYSVDVLFEAAAEPDMLVHAVSAFDEIDVLCDVAEVRHSLRREGPSVTTLMLEPLEESG